MIVHYGLDSLSDFPDSIVTTGTFDGVHLGHVALIERLGELSAQHSQSESVLLTYWPHPRTVLAGPSGQPPIELLSDLDEKIEILKQTKLDKLIVLPFTQAFARLSSQQFIEDILIKKLKTKVLVMGHDHRFGHNREGSFEYLQANQDRFGFEIVEILPQESNEIVVSSTRIRQALQNADNGKLHLATELLGRPYNVSGMVVGGQKIGRTIGFATANLEPRSPIKLLPAAGVYVVRAHIQDQSFQAICNIGPRPTVDNQPNTKIEVHILDFDGDIYGQMLTIQLLDYIRPQIKFDSLESLKSQLHEDKQFAMQYFG